MPLERLRIAFIGAGFVNFGGGEGPWDHASRLEKMNEVEVVAICEPDESRARMQLERRRRGARPEIYGSCELYRHWRKMLDDARPDAVIIGLPPAAHGRLSGEEAVELACANAGVHMLIEKPLAVSDPGQVRELAAELSKARSATAGPLVTSVGYMLRYHNVVNELRDLLIANERQGRPAAMFLGRYAAAYEYILSPAFWDARRSGGPIVEQATHFVDLARYLMGEIELSTVVASQITPAQELGQLHRMPLGPTGKALDDGVPQQEQVARATLAQWRFTSGAIGCLAHSVLQHGMAYDTELEVWGDGFRGLLTDPYAAACELHVREGDFRAAPKPISGVNDPYLAEMETFIRAIREGRPDIVKSSYADAAKTFEATCRITAAAKDGR